MPKQACHAFSHARREGMVANPTVLLTLFDSGPRIVLCQAPRLTITWRPSKSPNGPHCSSCGRRSLRWSLMPIRASRIEFPLSGCKGKSLLDLQRSRTTSAICPTVVPCFQPCRRTLSPTGHRVGRFSSLSTRRCPNLSSRNSSACGLPRHSRNRKSNWCGSPRSTSAPAPATGDAAGLNLSVLRR